MIDQAIATTSLATNKDVMILIQEVSEKALKRKNSGETIIEIVHFKVEVDEMQSFVEKKSNQQSAYYVR